MTTRRRTAGIDAVRVLGIVAVVTGHVFDGDVVRATIYTWHVPLFFFLSGYLWKSDESRPRTLGTEWRSRSRSLLVPYALWLVLISVAFVPWSFHHGGSAFDAVRPLLGGAFVGLPYSAFWFVTALAAATLLLRALDRAPAWVAWVLAGGGVVAATAAPAALAAVPLSLGVAVPALAFLLIGRAFRRLEPAISRPVLTSVLLAAGAVVAIGLGSAPVDLKQADFGTPVVSILVAVALSAALTLAGKAAGQHLGPRQARAFTAMALCGIGVVLTHSAVIWLAGSVTGSRVVVLLLAIALPWAIMLALHRTRLAPLLLGVDRRASREPDRRALADHPA